MKRMKLTDAQARAYIQGEEPFDEIKRKREHAERLVSAVRNSMIAIDPIYFPNLLKTAEHYLESEYMHFNDRAKKELGVLIHEIKKAIKGESK